MFFVRLGVRLLTCYKAGHKVKVAGLRLVIYGARSSSLYPAYIALAPPLSLGKIT